MTKEEILNSIMGTVGLDKTPYYCVKCKLEVDKIPVKTMLETPRKLFYCKNTKCERFGIVTVVVKKNP